MGLAKACRSLSSTLHRQPSDWGPAQGTKPGVAAREDRCPLSFLLLLVESPLQACPSSSARPGLTLAPGISLGMRRAQHTLKVQPGPQPFLVAPSLPQGTQFSVPPPRPPALAEPSCLSSLLGTALYTPGSHPCASVPPPATAVPILAPSWVLPLARPLPGPSVPQEASALGCPCPQAHPSPDTSQPSQEPGSGLPPQPSKVLPISPALRICGTCPTSTTVTPLFPNASTILFCALYIHFPHNLKCRSGQAPSTRTTWVLLSPDPSHLRPLLPYATCGHSAFAPAAVPTETSF